MTIRRTISFGAITLLVAAHLGAQDKPFTGSMRSETARLGSSDQSDYVLEVRNNSQSPASLPSGLWVSSVPPGLDVFIFPERHNLSDIAQHILRKRKGQSVLPFFVGTTPTYVRLRVGRYRAVTFHAPLQELDASYKEGRLPTGRSPRGRAVSIPRNPFIGPSDFLYVDGLSVWCVIEDIEITNGLLTSIGLFQRRDTNLSYLLPLLPKDGPFPFRFSPSPEFWSQTLEGKIGEKDRQVVLEVLRRGGAVGVARDQSGEAADIKIELRPDGSPNVRQLQPVLELYR